MNKAVFFYHNKEKRLFIYTPSHGSCLSLYFRLDLLSILYKRMLLCAL